MKLVFGAAIAACASLLSSMAAAAVIPVVAAENFYGDVVNQIGGANVAVTSILTNPNEDPHLFEASPATARALTDAKLVIYNGVDYDPWMQKLLSAHNAAGRTVIIVGDLVHHTAGDNPHLWYDPQTMPAAAKAIAEALAAADPAHKGDYEHNLATFVASLQPFQQKVASVRQRYAGTIVTATEPVAGYLCEALGFRVRDKEFQIAVMNDAEPTPRQVAGFENDIKNHAVKVLLYNTQATEDLTKRMRSIALESKVPVVGVSETEPPGMTYQAWMMTQLDGIEKALGGAS